MTSTAMTRFPRIVAGLIFLLAAWPLRADTPAAEPPQSDPDAIARDELESARADLKAGRATKAMNRLSAVFALRGVSELYRVRSLALTVELSLGRGDWKLAKRCAERVVNSPEADPADRVYCEEVLRNLRQDHPEVFR